MKIERRRIFLDGRTYHITHRCHNRAFNLKFAQDRDNYLKRIWEGKCRYDVSILDFVITCNHVHLLMSAVDGAQISGFMQFVSSLAARDYNRRKERSGGFWEGRYRSTLVQDGDHLRRCLFYIGLNMVRAGAVGHPREWRWSGYSELTGWRKRYRLLNTGLLRKKLECGKDVDFAAWYEKTMDEKISSHEALRRQEFWSNSKAVGDQSFVSKAAGRKNRGKIVETDNGICYF